MLTVKKDISPRDRVICEAVLSGQTYESIGSEFGLTRERVRQIINKYPEYRKRIMRAMYGACSVCGKYKRSTRKREDSEICNWCWKKIERERAANAPKKWARKYDACVVCGGTESGHHGHGVCRVCFDKRRWNDPEYRERRRVQMRKYYFKHKERINKLANATN